MYQDENGRWHVNVVTQDEHLVEQVEEYLDNHPDVNKSQLFRRAVREKIDMETEQ